MKTYSPSNSHKSSVVCLLCEKHTEALFDEKRKRAYYYCSSCSLYFKDPKSYQSFVKQKERYDLHENNQESEGYRNYFQRFLDFLSLSSLEGVDLALDFGCGRSRLLASMMKEEGVICDSYDPIYAPFEYEKKRYDLIVSTEVFEHLHHPKESFVSLLGALREGGYLAIQTAFHPQTKEAFFSWYYTEDTTHIVFFSIKSFEVLALAYGCKVIRTNGKNMILLQKRGNEEILCP